MRYFFKKAKTFAVNDAVEIKEGKFSVLKTTGFAILMAAVGDVIYFTIAFANTDLTNLDGCNFLINSSRFPEKQESRTFFCAEN